MIVRYAYWAPATEATETRSATSTHYDDMYVDHTTRRVWNVQDMGINDRLAFEVSRDHAARWLRIRRTVPNEILTSGYFHRYTETNGRPLTVPHMPVFEYAEDKIVLHEGPDDSLLRSYGRRSGTSADGSSYIEERISADNRDDWHFHTECDEHGQPVCGACGMLLWEKSDDCPEVVWPDCNECMEVYNCKSDNCDCIDKLEQCRGCNKDLGDGDTAWLCLDGGEYYCPEHVIIDERPDSLFKKVGAIRGEMLPAFAWPGGYCIRYYTRDGTTVCHECASQVEISDPATEADIDEEMDCTGCEHAQSFHRSEKSHRTEGDTVEFSSNDVGPCEYGHDGPDEDEVWHACQCDRYMPPLCEDCNKPIDPSLRKQEVAA